jgi:beta-glucosidase
MKRVVLSVMCSAWCVVAFAQDHAPESSGQSTAAHAWMDRSLPAEKRASMVLQQMTLDEKILLVHGEGFAHEGRATPEQQKQQLLGNGGVGLAIAPTRLGIPVIDMSDAAYGVRSSAENGRYSTALPSNVGSAASWDPQAACAYGTLIGTELRDQGFNMTLGGGTNLTREPRNGRTFEYMGEDPLLAGVMVGNRIRCEGAQHILSDIKHYAMNDQESGRTQVDVHVSEKAMRESDLLAFQIGVRIGHPKAVMCSYNGVNGNYACENKYLLTDVMKNELGFQGFVVSDWGGTHSTEKASAAGLDMEQPGERFYGAALREAVTAGRVPMAELDDHVRRILWAEFASGVVDYPKHKMLVDPQAGFDVSRRTEEQSMVLLKNVGVLPLNAATVRSVAVIGGRADYGTISGGGSAQVDAPGDPDAGKWQAKVWFPDAPLAAMQAKSTGARFTFASGESLAEAVAAAKSADVAVVFATQWESEGMDLPNLSLPDAQDRLIEAVAAANPRTIVVLETGTAVTMPWLGKVAAVAEAWYPGSKGGDAIANVLYGDVNPSGKLPMTFPVSEADLPHRELKKPPAGAKGGTLDFVVDYSEGAEVGYKWYEAEKKPVLFPFGFGLSYTSFAFSGLTVSADGAQVSFTVKNTGTRKGAEVAEVYATIPASAGEPWKRLVGWQKVELMPGESRMLTIATEALPMEVWDVTAKKFVMTPGAYELMVGGSSEDVALRGGFTR